MPESRGAIVRHASTFHRFQGTSAHWREHLVHLRGVVGPVEVEGVASRELGQRPEHRPDVTTGEQIRSRLRAAPIRSAARWATDGGSGRNHGVTEIPCASRASGPRAPLPSSRSRRQSSSKFAVYAAATEGSSTVTITFSSRVNASSVQFVEPVSTRAPSAIAYLWCISAPRSCRPRVGTSSPSIASGSAIIGRGADGASLRSTLKITRTVTPRASAPSRASARRALAPARASKS